MVAFAIVTLAFVEIAVILESVGTPTPLTYWPTARLVVFATGRVVVPAPRIALVLQVAAPPAVRDERRDLRLITRDHEIAKHRAHRCPASPC